MSSAENPEPRLRAGTGRENITPWAGVQLAGDIGRRRPATLCADPLFARALTFEVDGQRLAFLSLDVTIITRENTEHIRRQARERFGIEPDALMVHATQTHTAPSIGDFMLDPDFEGIPDAAPWVFGGDKDYTRFAVGKALAALEHSVHMLQPVSIAAGSAIDGRWAHNRRAVRDDGTVAMPGPTWADPRGPTWIRYLEGPIDPEVGVLAVRAESLRLVSTLLSYGCHPVHLFPRPVVSADWPGAWGNEMRCPEGTDCVHLVLNGPCGNVNPWDPYDPYYANDYMQMAQGLAETTRRVLQTLVFTAHATLDWQVRHLKIPIREVEPDRLAWARGLLEEHPTPKWADEEHTAVDWEWMTAASVYSVHLMREREGTEDYEIQVLRVGDTAFVGLPGEPFAELGLAIKMASRAAHTYVVHCTSHYVGYLPTPEAFARGGHECETRYWSKLVPEAYDMILDAATETLREMFPS